ncbi:hypothetical protein [Pseudonocardia lacus]|uniref:hypothetical protein n=1 Tax=Pseudonocardia lacus TaxID=2835865 RepID=UPI001BDD127E|nr:hypothetical protein [Pseudonocardia lacus]
MSLYHLHARALEGPLDAPRRDEVRVSQTDDADEADRWTRSQLDEGFTVWVYDHGRRSRLIGASDFRLIGHYRPRAARPPLTRHPAPDPHHRAETRLRSAG